MKKVFILLVVLGLGLSFGFSTGYKQGFIRGVDEGNETVLSENLVLDIQGASLVRVDFVGAGSSDIPVIYDRKMMKRYVVLEVDRWGSAATGFETSGYVEPRFTDHVRAADGKVIAVLDYRIPGR